MFRALFPGSFDPPTVGHLNCIERSLKICDELHVVIAQNPDKHTVLLTPEERLGLFQRLQLDPRVKICIWSGLLIDYAKQVNANGIIRSLRNAHEWDIESPRAWIQREMVGIETLFLPVDPAFSGISGSLVREVGRFAKTLHGLVPAAIEAQVLAALQKQ